MAALLTPDDMPPVDPSGTVLSTKGLSKYYRI